MTVLESEFQSHLLVALNAAGRDTRVWRQNAGKMQVRQRDGSSRWIELAPKGSADLTGIVRPEGWRLEVEVKGFKTAVKKHQVARSRFIEAFGGVSLKIRYDEEETLEQNVERGVQMVDDAIGKRRGRSECPACTAWRHFDNNLSRLNRSEAHK